MHVHVTPSLSLFHSCRSASDFFFHFSPKLQLQLHAFHASYLIFAWNKAEMSSIRAHSIDSNHSPKPIFFFFLNMNPNASKPAIKVSCDGFKQLKSQTVSVTRPLFSIKNRSALPEDCCRTKGNKWLLPIRCSVILWVCVCVCESVSVLTVKTHPNHTSKYNFKRLSVNVCSPRCLSFPEDKALPVYSLT